MKNPFQTGDVKTSIPKMLVGQTPRFSNYEYDYYDDDQPWSTIHARLQRGQHDEDDDGVDYDGGDNYDDKHYPGSTIHAHL